ncbi:MAG: tRNA 4-thiouridine(8) synthase ThiI [Verrucomicrobia bacterium]|nr:tRNA 4-thiouridine(8) synthase ThiI [Verrucomicrobiota bacterium]
MTEDTASSTAQWDSIVIRFAEIILKRGNRSRFTVRLRQNLQRVADRFGMRVSQFHDRLLIENIPTESFDQLLDASARVLGITHVSPMKKLPLDVGAMGNAGIATYQASGIPNATFGVRVRRANKSFPSTSQETAVALGGMIQEATGATVNLGNPDVLLTYSIYSDSVYLEGPRLSGPGGLPMGVSGHLLTLFSGGIDSPAAAWLMMRRGCTSDYLHYHVFPRAEGARDTKIPRMIEQLTAPQGATSRLFLVPYHAFQLALMRTPVPPDLELVLFRRFMFRTAGEVARKRGHAALVTGDCLSQVASQTMENLLATANATPAMVFRPLLTYEKMDVVELTKKIGTYEAAIEEYKDCCSLVSKSPRTRPKLGKVLEAEAALPVEKMTADAIAEMEVWEIG